jgi:acyl carrier protein
MIPQRLTVLDALPRTSSGKVDRTALATLPAASANGTPTDGAPETETERKVRELWQELLAVDAIGRDDDFFALGGHSLLLMVLASRLRRAFDVDLDIATAFDRSTLGGLAAYVDGCREVQEGVA